jgi:hypothetical protein
MVSALEWRRRWDFDGARGQIRRNCGRQCFGGIGFAEAFGGDRRADRVISWWLYKSFGRDGRQDRLGPHGGQSFVARYVFRNGLTLNNDLRYLRGGFGFHTSSEQVRGKMMFHDRDIA